MHFNLAQEKTMQRLRLLQELLAEQDFHDEDCALLESQLNAAAVIGRKFMDQIVEMQSHLGYDK